MLTRCRMPADGTCMQIPRIWKFRLAMPSTDFYQHTNLEIKPIEAESLNQAQYSFPEESILCQQIDLDKEKSTHALMP